MRRRDYYWSLYHVNAKNQIDNLRTDQVEAVYAAIPESLRKEYFVWRDGMENWKPFGDFPNLLVSLRTANSQPVETPPIPVEKQKGVGEKTGKSKVVAKASSEKSRIADKAKLGQSSSAPMAKRGEKEMFELDANDEPLELSLINTGLEEDRNNFRFQKKFEVRIIAGDKVFQNETSDISLKGMQLAKPLPKNLPRYFNIEICRKNRKIPVVCSEVKNRDGSPSTRVRIEVNDYAAGLLELLLSA